MSPDEFPSLVRTHVIQDGVMYEWCAGTVIDERHVLSSARCFQLENVTYAVTDRQYGLSAKESETYGQIRDVEDIIIHPSYNATNVLNDVVVLRLSSPLDLQSGISLVNLNDGETCPEAYSMCTMAGWGFISDEGPLSDVPLKVDIPVQPQVNCSTAYSALQYGDDQICAGDDLVGGCQGDSGAPLFCECGGTVYQTGIGSYGKGCSKEGFPGVYSRVSSYLSWIMQVVSGDEGEAQKQQLQLQEEDAPIYFSMYLQKKRRRLQK
ncbi:trypsin-like [Babylonia areolata]|uniref:trypsin-like n=1 Tax=Babylonia areolata TaxID=304850 RepID=UPI003FD2249F